MQRQKIIRDIGELGGLSYPVMVLEDAARGIDIADVVRALDTGFVTVYNARGILFASRPAFEIARDAMRNGIDPSELGDFESYDADAV